MFRLSRTRKDIFKLPSLLRSKSGKVPEVPVESSKESSFTEKWTENMKTKKSAMKGPRFENTNIDMQPMPAPAIDFISKEPINHVNGRKVSCDGGDGPLGHPRVYINLDGSSPSTCGYCGKRFEQSHTHH